MLPPRQGIKGVCQWTKVSEGVVGGKRGHRPPGSLVPPHPGPGPPYPSSTEGVRDPSDPSTRKLSRPTSPVCLPSPGSECPRPRQTPPQPYVQETPDSSPSP